MIKSINSHLLSINQLCLCFAENTHSSLPPHRLFGNLLPLLIPPPPQPSLSIINLTDPWKLSWISALYIKGRGGALSFPLLSEADGKGGRKEFIYFLLLPKAISFLRVSSLHPHTKPNISLTDSGPTPAHFREALTDPVYIAWKRLCTAELSVSGFCKFYENFWARWFLAPPFPSS